MMIVIGLFLLILLIWWPLPSKVELPLFFTGGLLILIGGNVAYPDQFAAIGIGCGCLITWLEAIIAILIRRFANPERLLQFNGKTLCLMGVNYLVWLPLLFRQPLNGGWLSQQIIIWAQVINGLTSLGLLVFWLLILLCQQSSKPQAARVIIVLGAGLHKGKVPPVLAERLKMALKCWQEDQQAMIIVTGARLRDEKISEAAAMAQYLEQLGLPEDNIIYEERAKNTWDNLKNCQQLIQERSILERGIIVITSSFHVIRTKNYVQRLHLDWPVIASKTPWRYQPLTIVRDYLGIIRDHYRSWLVLLLLGIIVLELVEL